MQLGSLVGQAQPVPPVVGSGGGAPVPLVPPLVVEPVEPQPQPLHDTAHIWPVGQSVSALQPVWMLGTQTP